MIAVQKVHSFASILNYNDEKLYLADKSKRAELLAHNFLDIRKEEILKEVKLINSFNTRVKNDGYHAALSFSENDTIDDVTLIAIADDYKRGMGYTDDHLFLLYKHNDGEDHRHIHIHLLLHRLAIDPNNGKARLVSDSHNFARSEKLCRQLEQKYGLEVVPSSKEALDRAPTKNELEMIQRTGHVSERMLLQEKVKLALANSESFDSFVKECGKQGVHLLFNQSETTGHISGITFISEKGFICKGKKLGNQFKWGNLKSKINYNEQSRERAVPSETNRATREKFGSLLERDKGGEKMDGGTGQTSRNHYEKSSSSSPNDGGTFRESRSDTNYSGTTENTTGIQENEKTNRDQFSNGYRTPSSSISSNSYPVSDVDEEEEERKRKRKWRRRR